MLPLDRMSNYIMIIVSSRDFDPSCISYKDTASKAIYYHRLVKSLAAFKDRLDCTTSEVPIHIFHRFCDKPILKWSPFFVVRSAPSP